MGGRKCIFERYLNLSIDVIAYWAGKPLAFCDNRELKKSKNLEEASGSSLGCGVANWKEGEPWKDFLQVPFAKNLKINEKLAISPYWP